MILGNEFQGGNVYLTVCVINYSHQKWKDDKYFIFELICDFLIIILD